MPSKIFSLSRIADIALIVGCLAVTVTYGKIWFSAPAPKPSEPTFAEYAAGDVVAPDVGGGERRLLIFLNSHCRYCEASMPFYKALSETSASSSTSAKVFVVSRESDAVTQKLLRDNNVQLRILSIGSRADIRLMRTPTILLTRSDGSIEKIWLGQLSPDREPDVFAAAGLSRPKALPPQ